MAEQKNPTPAPKPVVKSAAPAPIHAATTRAQEHRTNLMKKLVLKFKGLLKVKLGVEAEPTSDVVEVDGKTYTIHGSSIFVIAPCPKCGKKVARATPVEKAEDVGPTILKGVVAFHNCAK